MVFWGSARKQERGSTWAAGARERDPAPHRRGSRKVEGAWSATVRKTSVRGLAGRMLGEKLALV